MLRRIYLFTRVAYITWVGLWLLISLASCLYCEDAIKSKIIYSVLIRLKIRPKHMSALNKRHVKKHFFKSNIKFYCCSVSGFGWA